MRRTVLLCGVLLIPATIWLVLARSESPTPPAGSAAARGEREPGAAAADARAVAAGPESRLYRSYVADSAPSAPASIPADAKWVDVALVAKGSGEPVVGAEVAWMDAGTVRGIPAEELRRIGTDHELAARGFGWRTRSDARGIARVHLAEWTIVVGRARHLYGALRCVAGEAVPPGGYRLELAPDRTLLARVLDPADRPAFSVPIAIALHDSNGAFLRLWNGRPIGHGSAPDGIVRLAHFQLLPDYPQGGGRRIPASSWRVRVQLPGLDDPGVAFDPEAPPAEPIVLHIPATGSVTARVELAGRVVPEAREVGLYLATLGDSLLDPDYLERSERTWIRPVGDDGVARFPHVPLGLTLTAFAHFGTESVTTKIAGPRAAGEEVRVTIEVPRDEVVLIGRVLDERHEPLREARLSVRFDSSGASGAAQLETDRRGAFRFYLGSAGGQRVSLSTFVLESSLAGPASVRASLAARELGPGVHDAGDLVLRPGPLAR